MPAQFGAYNPTGLPVNRFISNKDGNGNRVTPVWQPWPGERLSLAVDKPAGVDGQTVTVQTSRVLVNEGVRANDVSLSLAIRSSRGVPHQIKLPEGAEVQELSIDNVKQRVQLDDNVLTVLLKPGTQDVVVTWREESNQPLRYAFPEIDLNLPSVNAHSQINLPGNKWVLWVSGPVLGPAVLFWSVLAALFLLSLALGRSKLTPLKTWQWFLLAIGLSQTSPTLILVVVAGLVGLSLRERLDVDLSRMRFNLMQLSLIGLALLSLMIIVGAVANGLLGRPDMQIAGNGSRSTVLKWFQDRSSQTLPQPEVISVPIWVYRILMLAWATWLAKSLLNWIQWGWQALSKGELWRGKEVVVESESERETET